jgi:hypothetical protein
MDKVDAFKILDLPSNASVDHVKVKFHELAQIYHTDHGGDKDKMTLYIEAYKAALEENNEIAPSENTLVTFSDLNKILTSQMSSLEKTMRQTNSYKTLKEQVIRDRTRSNKSHQRFAFYTGSLSTLLFFILDKMDLIKSSVFGAQTVSSPLIGSEFSLLKQCLFIYAVFFGLMYIVNTFKITRVKHAVEDITDLFESKNKYFNLLQEFRFLYCTKFKADNLDYFTENNLISIIQDWSGNKEKNSNLSFFKEIVGDVLLDNPAYLKKACDVIGNTYFARIFISKGLEIGLLDEHEKLNEGKLLVQYSISLLEK